MSGPCCVTAARRVRRSASWVAPTAVLLVVPKCPVCLAGYLVAATGVSVSAATAGWVRVGLVGASVATLLGLSADVLRRWLRSERRGGVRGVGITKGSDHAG